MRVGRAALDEEAIRLIEQHNPDVHFDWTRILKGEKDAASAGVPGVPRVPRVPRVQVQVPGVQVPPVQVPSVLVPQDPELVDTEGGDPGEAEPVDFGAPESFELTQQEPLEHADPEPLELQEPEPLELVEPEREPAEPEPEPEERWEPEEPRERPAGLRESAALRRLGAEGLLRLRARYSEVMARITERVSEPDRQEELKTQAERLNPDTWVTDAEVAAGLEQYESSFAALRAVIGGAPRRRRRRGRGGGRSRNP